MPQTKRNSTRAVFTSHERALAKSNWTDTSARLSRDSFLPFGSCGLCLEIARDPVACQRGDLFCRECALTNLMAQKKELKRIEKAKKNAAAEDEQRKEEEDAKQKEKDVKSFELTQAGLSKIEGPKKRKFDTGRESEAKLRKTDDGDAKEILPSFWTPSLTPDANPSVHLAKINKTKTAAVCPASTSDTHVFSMAKMIPVNFSEERLTTSADPVRSCPSCRKTLSNSLAAIAASKCGHVLCRKCVDQFLIKPTKDNPGPDDMPIMCFVCDIPVALVPFGAEKTKELPVGLVIIKSEGTGFSAKGANTVERSSTMFQC